MNTPELRFILENCFSYDQLQAFFVGLEGQDPYDTAVESILAEDEAGVEITRWLDEKSAPQRIKIKSMPAKALRDSLQVEFLEPGRKLGFILWALLRDDRISARSLAGQISAEISTRQDQESDIRGYDISALTGMSILDADEGDEEDSASEKELDEFLQDLETNDLELYSEDEINEILDEEDLQDLKSVGHEGDVASELSEEEVQSLIDSLSSEEENEEDLPLEDFYNKQAEQNKPLPAISPEDEDLHEDLEDLDDLIASLGQEEHSLMDEDHEWDDAEEAQLSKTEESAPSTEKDSNSVTADVAARQHSPSVSTVRIGGIDISLSSLKMACEHVFNEPIELVTDENLTRQDKIVVIGQNCGVRVLNGPRYQIPRNSISMPLGDQTVTISPESIQIALSRIYGEPIEIVPDPELLEQGIIIFAGKQTGLEIVENPRTVVTIPEWSQTGQTIIQMENERVSSAEVDELQQRITDLEERLSNLEQDHPLSSSATTVFEESPSTTTKHHTDAVVSHQPIDLDEIESEELDPVSENYQTSLSEQDDLDDDILAAISAQEDEKKTEEDDDENLNALLGDMEGENLGLEEEDEEEDDLNLDDLDLDALTADVEAEEDIKISARMDAIGEDDEDEDSLGLGGEINLDDIDLSDEELDLNSLQGLELDEDDEELESGIGGEIAEQKLDLDVLAELEKEVPRTQVKKVFHGEHVLLLGGEEKHKKDYARLVSELGGTGEWRARLNDMAEDEISEMVERADLIVTLASDSISDPGILQAANYAQDRNKRLFQHHSANPNSVRKKLAQLVEEGKV